MATGNYGIVRPADITPDDVEIFYHFSPSRNSIGNTTLLKLDPNDVLIPIDNPNKTQSNITGFETFGGLYTFWCEGILYDNNKTNRNKDNYS